MSDNTKQAARETVLRQPFSVSIHLDGMRSQIVHAFSGYESDIETRIDEGIREAIARFNFTEIVQREAEHQLRAATMEAIRSAVARLFWDDAVKEALYDTLKVALRRVLNEP